MGKGESGFHAKQGLLQPRTTAQRSLPDTDPAIGNGQKAGNYLEAQLTNLKLSKTISVFKVKILYQNLVFGMVDKLDP